MGIATGTVVQGKVLIEGLALPEGTVVTVVTHESNTPGVLLSPEDEADLLAAVEEADRGDTITADELFQRLDLVALARTSRTAATVVRPQRPATGSSNAASTSSMAIVA